MDPSDLEDKIFWPDWDLEDEDFWPDGFMPNSRSYDMVTDAFLKAPHSIVPTGSPIYLDQNCGRAPGLPQRTPYPAKSSTTNDEDVFPVIHIAEFERQPYQRQTSHCILQCSRLPDLYIPKAPYQSEEEALKADIIEYFHDIVEDLVSFLIVMRGGGDCTFSSFAPYDTIEGSLDSVRFKVYSLAGLVSPQSAVQALKLCSEEVVMALGNWSIKITESEVHVHLIEWTDEVLHLALIKDEVLGPPLIKYTISRF